MDSATDTPAVEAPAQPPVDEAEVRRTILATPAGFARGVLGVELYDWQADFLNAALESPGASSMRAPNEAGKTRNLIAPMVLYVLSVFKGAQVVITSGSWRQVQYQLFPAMARHAPKFPGWHFLDTEIKAANGSLAVGFSTDDAGRFEGFHVAEGGHRETPLLIVYDESKSIAESIFMAGDRCRPTWEVMLSSTGLATGRFYKSHTSQRSLYRAFKVTLNDCPHISRDTYARDLQKYGENAPFIRSAYWAEFMDDGGGKLIVTLKQVEDCLERPTAKRSGTRHGFCDFAAGRAENVFAVRDGNAVRIVKAWPDRNTMSAVGEFIAQFRKEGFTQETAWQLSGDADGLGAPMLDRLAELGWVLNRFHGGSKASDPRVYANRSAEIWSAGAKKIERCDVHLPNDPQLIEQLTSRMYKRVSDGTLLLESKEDMSERGLPSPDRADAVLGCLEEPPVPFVDSMRGTKEAPWAGLEGPAEEREHEVLQGWNCGG